MYLMYLKRVPAEVCRGSPMTKSVAASPLGTGTVTRHGRLQQGGGLPRRTFFAAVGRPLGGCCASPRARGAVGSPPHPPPPCPFLFVSAGCKGHTPCPSRAPPPTRTLLAPTRLPPGRRPARAAWRFGYECRARGGHSTPPPPPLALPFPARSTAVPSRPPPLCSAQRAPRPSTGAPPVPGGDGARGAVCPPPPPP